MSDDPTHLPPPPPPPGDVPPPPAGWAPAPTLPPSLAALRGLATAVTVLVGVVGLVNVLKIPNDLAYIASLEELAGGDFSVIDEIDDQEDLRATFGVLALLALVVTGVVWIVWQQRARKNAKALGASGQRHTEPLAALSWIIPFANFVLPKQVTNDLWRASDPEAPPATNVEGRPVSPLIDIWWGLWLLGAILGRVLLNTESPESFDELDGLINTVRLEIGAQLLVVVSAVLAVLIVRHITERLGQRATRHGLTLP